MDPTAHRIGLKLQYLGTHFWGWQRQSRHRSVQAVLEETISQRAGHPVIVHGAGRTDTGVHAAGQVAHFETSSRIPAEQWALVLNKMLPPDVAILGSALVPAYWHSRFTAIWRRYRYLILNQEQPDIFWRPFSWHQRATLDVSLMAKALDSIVGNHSLEAFRRAGSLRPHSWVTVQAVQCYRQHQAIVIEVQASGFLYRMMRLLVGALNFVGRQELSVERFIQMWQQNDWTVVPTRYTAPAQGLCLLGVGYPTDPFVASRSESVGEWMPIPALV